MKSFFRVIDDVDYLFGIYVDYIPTSHSLSTLSFTRFPSYLRFCFPQFVTHGQLWSENIRWKILEINNS